MASSKHRFRAWVWLSLVILVVAACGDDGDGEGTGGDTVADTTPEDTTPEDTTPQDTAPDEETSAPDVDEEVEDAADAVDPLTPPPHQREEAAAAQGALRAGVGMAYISGPVGISMAGYGGRFDGAQTIWSDVLKGTQGFYGYQTVKAMVLEVDGERLVIVKLPTMSSESSLTDAIARKMHELYGEELTGRILTGATHSHHTNARYWRLPATLGAVGSDSPDEEVIDMMATAFSGAIKAAIDDLDAAQWAWTARDDWDPDDRVSRDRRGENNALGYGKDPRLTLLAVRRPDGTPMATVINFASHGTVFGDDNDLLTEDAAAGLELKFEERFYAETGQPILGMFIQSGGGDASPAGDHLGHPPTARVELIGETAAPRIMALYEGLEWRDEATLAVRSRRIDLRYDWMGYPASGEFVNSRGQGYTWGGWQCSSPGVEPGASMEGHPKACTDVGGLLRVLGEETPHAEVHQLYLSVARLDELFLVTIPGEPAYSVVKYLREQVAARGSEAAPAEVMAMGYAQDHLLYFTHPDDWYMGGYESEMSLWGPLAGQYVVDRQLELVDDLREGYSAPVFYEESPNLSSPTPFEPRAFEASEAPGAIDVPVASSYERTDLVRWGVVMGDPSVGSPRVHVEVEQADGTFAPVAHPAGFEGEAYDNTRYHMITHYRPEPPASPRVEASRRHLWLVDWEVPEDFPAGTYRLVARGDYWDGGAEQALEVTSAPFTITQAADATLSAALDAQETLTLELTLPPVALTHEGDRSWPMTGWRLMDPTVGPDAPITVRAPLRVTVLVDGAPASDPLRVAFDEAAGAHVVDLGAAGVDVTGGAPSVRVHLDADHTPSPLEAPITTP